MTSDDESLDDIFEEIDRELKHGLKIKDDTSDPVKGFHIEPADSTNIYPDAIKKHTEFPFGIEVTSETLHENDNAKIFTIITLGIIELIPVDERQAMKRIKVATDIMRIMQGQIYIPWEKRRRRRLADWLVDLQLSGCYSCLIATNSYNTHLGHDIVAITVLVRRLPIKEDHTGKDEMKALVGTIVCLMNNPVKELSEEDEFLRKFVQGVNANDAEMPESMKKDKKETKPKYKSEDLMPRAPNSTEVLDKDGVFVNFFLEIKSISYEVEARSLGDVS